MDAFLVLGLCVGGVCAGGLCIGGCGFMRGCVGGLVGLLKIPTVALPAICRGKTPPPFTAGASLGAELMGGGFADLYLTSGDGTKLHAVEDNGSRRVAGKRPVVFVHGACDRAKQATFAMN